MNHWIIYFTAFFNCEPAPKVRAPTGIGRTDKSVIGSARGSVGESSSGFRIIPLNIATSSLSTHSAIICAHNYNCITIIGHIKITIKKECTHLFVMYFKYHNLKYTCSILNY